MKPKRLSRRDFLKTSTLAGGGLLIAFTVPAAPKFLAHQNAEHEFSPNALLRIGADDTVHIILSKVEMGQGIWTTLPMLIAEELDCAWSKIKVSHRGPGKTVDFAESIYVQSTGGSDSTRSEFERYRMAGATARTMLVHAAAQRWNITPNNCHTENGFVIAGEKRLRYGDLVTEAAKQPMPTVALRPPATWKYIGKPQPRLDSATKVSGKATYGIDIQAEGLFTAVIAYPPVFGAKVKSFDATKTNAVAGVREVIAIPAGVAVIADHFWAAKTGRDALMVTWDVPGEKVSTEALREAYRALGKTTGVASQQKGDVATALAAAPKTLDVELWFPYLAHAPMEPLNCTVKISGDTCEVWAGTQSPVLHQQEVAEFLGLPPEKVLLHTPLLGGSFGRRGSFKGDWLMDAVHIAKASGKFIKLVWSREDDIKGGYYRPAYLHSVRIAVGADGFPTAWQHRIVGQSLFTGTILEKDLVSNGIDWSTVGGVHGSPYLQAVAHHAVELHTTKLSVPVLAWRSVGNTHTCFAMETLIDELAILASKDPVAYRSMLLKNHPRHLAALNLAVEKSSWNMPLPAKRFRGVAVHEAMGSYVAQVIEVSVEDKKINVHRVVCAIECGLAVNPDGVKAQMESGIIYGLTAALYGEISLEDGRVAQRNFNDYRMLRIHETPAIEVYIVQSSEPMGGAGEPGVPPVAPALANALFQATGKRLHTLPLKIV